MHLREPFCRILSDLPHRNETEKTRAKTRSHRNCASFSFVTLHGFAPLRERIFLYHIRLALVTSISIISFSLYAQIEVKITASKDNTLYENASGSFSNGSGAYFFAGQNNHGEARRGVLAFDLAGTVPAGAQIQSATLTLNMSKTISDAHTVALHRLLADWGEGMSNATGEEGGGAAAASGDATWIHTFFNTQRWTNAGGDFAGSASATQSVAGLGQYTWASTPEMVADVQSWLDAPAGNFGWLLMGNEQANASAKRFDARENPVIANRPVLTVIYTVAMHMQAARGEAPAAFYLTQNFPNPFNPTTVIQYSLNQNASVVLQVYAMDGRRLRTLRQGQHAAGSYAVSWDGKSDTGEPAASGVYLCKMAAGEFVQIRKMALLR